MVTRINLCYIVYFLGKYAEYVVVRSIKWGERNNGNAKITDSTSIKV